MKALTIATILVVGTVLAETVDVSKKERSVVRNGREIVETRFTCPLFNDDIDIAVARDSDTGAVNIDFHAGPGRWQRLIHFWRRGLAPGFPEHVMAMRTSDGDRAMVVATISVLADGERQSTLMFQAVRLNDFPDWIFYRFSSESAPLPLDSILMGVAMRPQPILKRPRTLFLCWPGGEAALGEDVSWFGTRPEFNALAWYSRGGDEEDMMAEFMVFDPADFNPISPTRWQTGDDRGVLRFSPLESMGEVIFARGRNHGSEDAKHVAVPRFFKDQKTAVIKQLKQVDWSLNPDWERLAKSMDDLEKTVRKLDDDTLTREFVRLKSNLVRAHSDQNILMAFKIDQQIQALKKQASSSMLNQLLE